MLDGSDIPLITNITLEKTKKIILWNTFHGDPTWYITDLGRTSFTNCEYTSCDVTYNKTDWYNADAILFDTMFIKDLDLPTHSYKQIWIFFNMESPIHTYGDLTSYDYIFNWTITYLPQSDIYNPYNSTAMKRKSKIRNTKNENYSYGKIELAIIVVSNCYANNRRFETIGVRSLEVRGGCSKNFPDTAPICYSNNEPTEVCMERYLSRYKFYLAFENSNCVHYITEKFFRALSIGMVPVVFGARYSDYVKIAPPLSFIFVASPLAMKAARVKELSKYLLKLDSNDTLYNEYHAWREEYIIVGKKNKHLCSICEHLHLKDIPNKSYKISDWWNSKRDCKN
ncbi:unnamed protein product [Gordionus sp. m RMFG-2023]